MEASSVFSSWMVVLLLLSVGEFSYGQGPCSSNPCDNGGSCLEIGDGAAFLCQCDPGFSGDTCTTNEAEESCDHISCANGATCTIITGKIFCNCTSEYTGETCDMQVDPCLPSPCRNGGTCEESIIDVTCTCANGFMGNRCQTPVDPCSPNPCLNGGSCTGDLVTSCTCMQGYTGDMCEMEVDPCSSNPCQNGGTCESNNGAFSCTCTAEFTGLICHMEVDPCLSNPCLNGGTCNRQNAVYRCNCAQGYTGATCDVEVDPCLSNPCLNGGTCSRQTAVLTCICAQGYTGATCDVRVPDNEATTQSSNTPTKRTDPCLPNPCQNGGICQKNDATFQCRCSSGYTGQMCETEVTDNEATTQSSNTPLNRTGGGTVPTWVIIIVAVAACIVFILVLVLFVIIMKGKRRGKSKRNRLSNSNPRMIAEFTRNVPEGDSASMDNESIAETNLAYDPNKLDAYDDPPPDYEDDRSLNGFRTPAPRIYDNNKVNLTKQDSFERNDYGDFTRLDDDGFDAALY